MLSNASELVLKLATLLGMELDTAEVQLHEDKVRISQMDGALFEVEVRQLREAPFLGNEDETLAEPDFDPDQTLPPFWKRE